MMYTKRIKKIASLVDKGVNVIDIGCDHGLLDIYLTKYNNNMCIASDIKESALNQAKNNFKKYNLKIETILSNGLEKINIMSNSECIIAGMGTHTIINILNHEKSYLINSYIIQTNNNYNLLRRFMVKKGYKIIDEITFVDKNIRYIIMKFSKGLEKYNNFQYLIGPILLTKQDSDTKQYLQEEYKKNNYIISKLSIKNMCKKIKLIFINKKIKKLI